MRKYGQGDRKTGFTAVELATFARSEVEEMEHLECTRYPEYHYMKAFVEMADRATLADEEPQTKELPQHSRSDCPARYFTDSKCICNTQVAQSG